MHMQDHIDDLAKELAGNWRDIEKDPMSGFVYHDPPWDPEEEETEGVKWCLVYTSNRDSGLMAKSNEAVMEKALKEFFGGSDIKRVRHSHWGPGYLDGYEIRVYDAEGNITPVFAKYAELRVGLAEYPVLDDEDYSRRQYEAACKNIEECGWNLIQDNPPEDWATQVYDWLWDNNQQAVEDLDDQGGYPSKEEIGAALSALGLSKEDEDD